MNLVRMLSAINDLVKLKKTERMSVFLVTPDNQWHELHTVQHTVMRDSGEENHVLLLAAKEAPDG